MSNPLIGSMRATLGLDTAQFEDGVKRVQTHLSGISKAFGVLGGSAVFAGFMTGLGAAMGRIEEARKLSAQLDKALENTGNTARTSAAEVEDFADRLERSTGRAAEEVMAVATNLATFGFGREQFFRAIELADDMAAAWGGDLKQNVEGLARALAEPEKGLAMLVKRGITFTDQQKQMIAGFMRTNDLAGAQGVIFGALEEQVQGVATAGFSGLTKATANAWKATEDFFETIAGGLQLTSGLESILVSAAGAIDLVTANLGTIGKVAAVAGAAVSVALGPSLWMAAATAATVFSRAAVVGITAIGQAIAANPIGLIVMALAAAVTAAFMFRDEIKQAIGVDVAGIIQAVGNFIIGSFVGAFKNVGAVWSNLPSVLGDATYSTANLVIGGIETMVNTAISLINELSAGARDVLKFVGLEVGAIPEVNLGDGLENPFAGAMGSLGQDLAANIRESLSQDYLGNLFTSVFGEDGPAPIVQGFEDIGAAAAGAGGRISTELQTALDALRQSLMTDQEAEMAAFRKRLTDIQSFYAAGLILKAEHDELLERSQAQHAERMAEITRRGVEEEMRLREKTVGNVSSIFGSIASIMEDAGQENLVAAKGFAVAQAIVNTAQGITAALTIPGPAGWAQAAAVAASGAAQISTILSASRGSSQKPMVSAGGGAGGGTTGGVPAQMGQQISMTWNVEGKYVSVDQLDEMMSAMTESLNTNSQSGMKLAVAVNRINRTRGR